MKRYLEKILYQLHPFQYNIIRDDDPLMLEKKYKLTVTGPRGDR